MYKYYKLTVTAIRKANTSVIIGDMELYATNYTNLNKQINQTSIGGDANVEAIFDTSSDTDWSVDIDASDTTKSVWWSMKKPVAIDAYSMVTAKEAESVTYDPKAWTLYGKNSTQDMWTEISSVTDSELPTGRSTVSDAYYVEESAPYKYYMLTITDNRGGNANNFKYQMSGIKLYNTGRAENNETDEYTDLYDQIIPSEEAKAVFDKDVATAWRATVDVENSDNVRAFSWEMKEAVRISAYTMVTASDNERSDPWSWTLYGTNDKNGTWTMVSSVTKSDLPEDRGEISDTYIVSSAGKYQHYKLEISNNRSDLGSPVYQLAELNLFATKQDDDDSGNQEDPTVTTASDITVDKAGEHGLVNAFDKINQTSITGDAGVKETNGIKLALDNNYQTKWCVEIETEQGECIRTLQWGMSEKIALEGYALVTAGDAVGKDPQKWVLYAANDPNGEWKVISTVNEGNLPEERRTATNLFLIQNPEEYQYYKLTILENKDGNGRLAQHYQFSELLLFNEGESGSQGGGEQEGEGGSQGGGSQENPTVTTVSDITVDKAGEHGLVNAFDKINQNSITGDAGVKETNGIKLALDNNYQTKWCVEIETEQGECIRTIQWGMSEKIALEGYALVTAGDAERKDPQKWVLYATNDPNGEWAVISTVNEGNLPEERRTATNLFLIQNPGEYQHYKLTILENKDGNARLANHYQFSELLLFNKGESGNQEGGSGSQEKPIVTTASDITVDKAKERGLENLFEMINQNSITGDAGVKETNGIKLALDNNYQTKWCVEIDTEKGECIRTLQWSMSEKVALEGYAFATAGDAVGKDPQKWVLYATNDKNGEWKVISTVNEGNLPEERKTTSNLFLIQNPGKYQHYKLTILENKNGNARLAKHYQFSELLLFGKNSAGKTGAASEQGISMQEAVKMGLVNVYSRVDKDSITGDEGVKATNALELLFDLNLGTKWCVETIIGQDGTKVAQWSMTEKLTLKGYAFGTGGDAEYRDPTKWKLYGTNDVGGEWTLLDEVKNATLPEERKVVTDVYMIDNPGEYQHYKLVITDNKGRRAQEGYRHYQLSEVMLFADMEGLSENNKVTYTGMNNDSKPSEEPNIPGISNGWWIIPIVTVAVAGVTWTVIYVLKRKKAKNEI